MMVGERAQELFDVSWLFRHLIAQSHFRVRAGTGERSQLCTCFEKPFETLYLRLTAVVRRTEGDFADPFVGCVFEQSLKHRRLVSGGKGE